MTELGPPVRDGRRLGFAGRLSRWISITPTLEGEADFSNPAKLVMAQQVTK